MKKINHRDHRERGKDTLKKKNIFSVDSVVNFY